MRKPIKTLLSICLCLTFPIAMIVGAFLAPAPFSYLCAMTASFWISLFVLHMRDVYVSYKKDKILT